MTILSSRMLGCCSLMALAAVMPAQAQERAAASSLETQMTWSTLSKLVEAANANSAAANMRLDQVARCNLKYKLYAPEGAKLGLSVDGDGCIFNQPVLDLADRVKKTEDEIIATNKKLTELEAFTKSEISRIDTKVADLAKAVMQLDGRVSTVETGLSNLTNRVKIVEDQIKLVNTKIAALQTTVDDHERRLDTAEATIKTHTSQIATHTTQIAAINSQITQINKDIAVLEKDVAALDVRVTDTALTLSRVVNCNKSGKLYSGSGTTCKTIEAGGDSISGCTISAKNTLSSCLSSGPTNATCGSGYILSGFESAGACSREGKTYKVICLKINCS